MYLLRQQWSAGSYVDGDGGTWCQAPKLKLGWQLWLGTHWVTITSLRVAGSDVLIGADDGRTYRTVFIGRVRCRVTSPRSA